MSYTLDQWVLFFFFYCLCGWIWESCYVSARQHRWVNRGFLHGPLLPIYGSGAVIVLLATLRVQGSLPLIALLGLLAATVLEYCTGAAMERLFNHAHRLVIERIFGGRICLFQGMFQGPAPEPGS
jgi:uncharacterized membrane protein